MSVRILAGDALTVLRGLPASTFQCCVTSPPYYGLRDYGVAGQIGLEETPDAYVARLVEVFREVRRVLRDDGVAFVNLGDSYAMSTKGAGGVGKQHTNAGSVMSDRSWRVPPGIKPKDLLGIPWMVAFALRADGWWLRSAIVWHKPNPMPESVRDRPTSAYEHVFLLAKRNAYFYDAEAIREPISPHNQGEISVPPMGAHRLAEGARRQERRAYDEIKGANARNVWTIATQPFAGAHFATMPPDLAERCIKAGSRPGDHVLDPFGGAGTTGLVADRLGRHATLIELNPEYAALARERLTADAPLLAEVAADALEMLTREVGR